MSEFPPAPYTRQDEEHLNILSICYYAMAGITALFSCFPIFHLAFGIFFILAPEEFAEPNGEAPPEFIGYLFAFIGGSIILFGWSLALGMLYAGRNIAQRKNWTYCVVVGAVSCMFMPLGTLLGVFTLIVLNRPAVKDRFVMGPETFETDETFS